MKLFITAAIMALPVREAEAVEVSLQGVQHLQTIAVVYSGLEKGSEYFFTCYGYTEGSEIIATADGYAERPHTALDKRTPDTAYFNQAEIRKAA